MFAVYLLVGVGFDWFGYLVIAVCWMIWLCLIFVWLFVICVLVYGVLGLVESLFCSY